MDFKFYSEVQIWGQFLHNSKIYNIVLFQFLGGFYFISFFPPDHPVKGISLGFGQIKQEKQVLSVFDQRAVRLTASGPADQ